MTINIVSYGCRNGDLDPEPTFLIDCHRIPNPYGKEGLHDLDGRSVRLQTWVMGWQEARKASNLAERAANRHIPHNVDATIAFECIGGRHRSASLAEVLYRSLTKRGVDATLTHRDIDRKRK